MLPAIKPANSDGIVLDALPYIDDQQYTDEHRQLALQLIQAECKKFPMTKNYLRNLPEPDYDKFTTPRIMEHQAKMANKQEIEKIDLLRYEVPSPANTSRSGNKKAWLGAIDNCRAQLSNQSLRKMNLELLEEFGPEAFLRSNQHLKKQVEKEEAELFKLRSQLYELNARRKRSQLDAGEKLAALGQTWVELVTKNAAMVVANDNLETEIRTLAKLFLIVAKLSGKDIKAIPQLPPTNLFPLGQAPAFDDGKVCLFGAEAISKYLLGTGSIYLPQNPELDQWIGWTASSLQPNVLSYVLPCVSAAKIDQNALETAKNELLAQLSLFDQILLLKTFLVGERLSLADISVAIDLLPAYQYVLGEEARKGLVNVNRWFQTVVSQPGVREVVGEFSFIKDPLTFDEKEYNKLLNAAGQPAKKKEQKPEKQKGAKEEKPKSAKEEKPKKKAKEEADEEMDAADEAIAAQPKFSDPLAALPPGSFVMDSFKRVYSNEDTATKAIPYFWENFDSTNYSIWFSEYKYPEELKLVYMSCNLIGGMFQRLEKMKKHAFASVCLFGTDNNSTISGIWIWRGQQLAFELCQDWQVDYESYEWKKLEPGSEADKKMVNEYFMWEGDFGGKKFNQGKIFK
ncbi:hypothetical protein niasHS_010785 [Heterodera schachtii]|uniref:eEF-1B gamma n=1 Tax=Heterodera schachtii TaxID=97005 RepID=A0ABD2J6E1_HETSC